MDLREIYAKRLDREEDDPFLPVEAWFPVFADLHRRLVLEVRDFDWLWVKENNPDLYRSLKSKEDELDALGEVRRSEVMTIIREWRELLLKAEFERRELDREARADISK